MKLGERYSNSYNMTKCSLAFRFSSSEGYFGIPKEIVAEVHVKALVDYSLGMGPLYPVLEIHLVDMNVDMLFAIKQAYEDWASSPGLQDMAEKYKSGKTVGAASECQYYYSDFVVT